MSVPICPEHNRPMRWWTKGKVYTCTKKIGENPDGSPVFCEYTSRGGSPTDQRAATGPGVTVPGEGPSPADRVAALNFAANIFQGSQDPTAAITAARAALAFLKE